jgi:8-oxo-dGTP diphosphatase
MPDPNNVTEQNPTFIGNPNPTPEQRARRIAHNYVSNYPHTYQLVQTIKEEIQEAVDKAKPVKPVYPVGVSVLLTISGRLLLGRRKNNKAAGWLGTPGGRLEPGETILECAQREFHEETGATLAQWKTEVGIDTPCIFYAEHHVRFDDNYVMVYVHANGYDGEIQNTEPDKCDGWRWWTGYNLIGRKDITEPENVLKALPLTWTFPKTQTADAVYVHGWNAALDRIKESFAEKGLVLLQEADALRK